MWGSLRGSRHQPTQEECYRSSHRRVRALPSRQGVGKHELRELEVRSPSTYCLIGGAGTRRLPPQILLQHPDHEALFHHSDHNRLIKRRLVDLVGALGPKVTGRVRGTDSSQQPRAQRHALPSSCRRVTLGNQTLFHYSDHNRLTDRVLQILRRHVSSM